MLVWLALSASGLAVIALGLLFMARTSEGRAAALTVLPVIALVVVLIAVIEILNRTGAASAEQATSMTESLFVVIAVGGAVAIALQTRDDH